MADIKSAREIAMEKIESLGEVSEAERLRWKYVPIGEQMAAKYLKEGSNLLAELTQHEEKVRKYIVEGAAGILSRYITLPKNEVAQRNNRKAMDGLKILKNDKAHVENVYSKIRYIFKHYAEEGQQQRDRAYQSLKNQFEAKVQQAMQQQAGMPARMRIDIERQPQFQEEWRRLQSQLDLQYLNHLNEYKRELAKIA